MADLFDFLGLSGFKRMHEYQYLAESMEHRALKRYYLNHHNKILYDGNIENPHVIPKEWEQYTRFDVTVQVRKQYIEKSFEEYNAWESETKKCYEDYAKALFDMGHVADFNRVNELVTDVDKELKYLDRLLITLRSVAFNEVYVATIQEEIHEEYKKKTEKLGVNFC